MFNNDVRFIVWMKIGDDYYSHINNCNIKKSTKMEIYMKNITYEESYKKIIETHENQIVNNTNNRILLRYIPDDIIVEICMILNSNMQLLPTISHKIRNPLANIIGVLKLIDKSKLNKTEKENMEILKKSCYEIINITNDIIDIINFSRGQYDLKVERVNLQKILTECYNIVIKEIAEKNLVLKIIIDKEVPNTIISDGTRFKQIIINLLTNSIQNTIIGGIIIHISFFNEKNSYNCPFEYVPYKKPKYNILISIKDSGTGMDVPKNNYVSSILGINKNINNTYKYTGLGLIISKYICNLMGGNIWFVSDMNIGTVFYFNILVEGTVNN